MPKSLQTVGGPRARTVAEEGAGRDWVSPGCGPLGAARRVEFVAFGLLQLFHAHC